MKKVMRSLLGIVVLSSMALTAWGQAKEVKLATIAPAGSGWDKITNAMNEELKQRSNGQIGFKIYAGGVQGDEKAVVQKIRSGQLHAGGLTGFGLGLIAPAVRVLEVPFLFSDASQIDSTTAKVTPQLEAALAAGKPPVELLGWAEAGFVYILSNKPIAKLSDMKGVKMWMWEGDPMAEALYSALGVVPIQLSIADVLTSLQTNMIEAVYAPPMGAVALQWASKVKYFTDLPLVNSIGALVMSKAEFNKLSADQRKLIKEVAAKYTRQIIDQTRRDNEAALASIQKLGVRKIAVAEADKQAMMDVAKGVGQSLVGKLYSQELLSAVQTQ